MTLNGCASLEPGEENLGSTFRELSKRNFDQAKIELAKAKGRDQWVYYWNYQKGAVYKADVYDLKNGITEIEERSRDCEDAINQINEADNFSYIEDNCLSSSSGGKALKHVINRIKEYSKVSLQPMFYDKNKKFFGKKANLEDDYKKQVQQSEMETLKQQELDEKQATLEARKDYQKCKIMDDIVKSRKMIEFSNRNIARVKANAKEVGALTNKMAGEIESTQGMRSAHNLRIKNNESELKKYSSINVSESQCKKLIENYGNSWADQAPF